MRTGSVSPEEDRRLVERYLQDRDEDSFLQLYRAHTPALFRMAWRLGDRASMDVEDAIQETWLRAARGLASFRFQSSLRTWLTSVLINCLRESRRRDQDTGMDVAPEQASPARSPVLQLDLERAIASLPPGMREVFVLFDVEGFTHDEVGAALEIERGTSKSQLFAARRKLRAALGARPRPVPFGRANHGT